MTTKVLEPPNMMPTTPIQSVHEFIVKDIDGEDVQLSTYKEKILLIVNVASMSSLTNINYVELTEMYTQYKEAGLEILGFPCNQFGGQESGSNELIKEFACNKFKVEFPMFDKIEVNGLKENPLYQFLKLSKSGGILGDDIKWNFTKFLVDHDGIVVNRYSATTNPRKIESDIKKLLEILKTKLETTPEEKEPLN